MTTLDHLRHIVLHVVAQIIEAELVIGAVGHVGGVGLPALIVVKAVHDDADGHTEELINLTHPLGVAAGKVVIHRDDVDALAGERIQINRGRGDQRLALASAHFGNRALVQHEPAHELDIEVALLERPLGGLAHGGESGRNEIVERLAGLEFSPQFFCLRAQLIVGQGLEFGLQRIDGGDRGPVAFEPAVVGRAKDPLHHGVELKRAEHFRPFLPAPLKGVFRFLPGQAGAKAARTMAATIKSAKKAKIAHFRAS